MVSTEGGEVNEGTVPVSANFLKAFGIVAKSRPAIMAVTSNKH